MSAGFYSQMFPAGLLFVPSITTT